MANLTIEQFIDVLNQNPSASIYVEKQILDDSDLSLVDIAAATNRRFEEIKEVAYDGVGYLDIILDKIRFLPKES